MHTERPESASDPWLAGAQALKDELALVDLGHSEKRNNRTIQLTTPEENLALLQKQQRALTWVWSNPAAAISRAESYAKLFSHAALPSVGRKRYLASVA